MDLACPECRTLAAAINADGSRKCMRCGHVWVARPLYPEPPPPLAAVAPAGPRKAVLVGAVLVSAIAASAVIALVASGASEPSYSSQPPVTVQSESAVTPPMESPPATPPKAEIGARCDGTSWGSTWHLVEYRNTGNVAIAFPKVIGRVTTEDGKLKEVEAVSNVYRLPPGESAWLHITLPNGTNPTLTIVRPEPAASYTPEVSRLRLRNFKAAPSDDIKGYTNLSGTLHNTSGQTLTTILVQAVGLDEAGKPCSYTLKYIDADSLAAGATANFEMLGGTWQTSVPTRWEIHPWGMIKK